jgi:PAS domain S-box-containing protein
VAARTSPTTVEVDTVRPATGTAVDFTEACLFVDRDLTVLHADAAFAAVLGQPKSNVIGRSLATLFDGGDAAPACRLARAAPGSEGYEQAFDVLGERRYRFRAHAVPSGVVLLCTEATVLGFEDSLVHTALQWRIVLEQLPIVHWTMDTDLRFTRSIGAGLAAMGLARGEATGLTIYEYLGNDDPNFLTTRMHLRALAGESIRYEDFNRGRHLDVMLEPLRDCTGRITGVLGLAHDVTERHEAAEERARLQERSLLAQKRESLGILAAGVAHDINNLLSAIVGSAGLLLRELPAGSAPHDSAVLIRKAAERAAEVTRQMLVYAGKTEPRRRLLDLSHLVRDNLSLIKAAIQRRVTLETRLADRLPPIDADPGQLQQVVMNLVLNAGEAASATGGHVRLTTGTAVEDGRPVAYLEVTDDGCGMPPEVVSRVFDPFFTTKGRGRGLGLSAVQGIVSAHGGQIELTSVLRQGTTFRVVLPVAEGAGREQTKAAAIAVCSAADRHS